MRRQQACKLAKGKHIIIHHSKRVQQHLNKMKPNDALARFIYNSHSITKNIYTIHISTCIIFMELPLPSNTKWIQNYLPVKIFFPSNLVQEEGTHTSVSQWRKRRRRKLHSSSYKPLSSHLPNHTCFLCSSFCNLSLCVSLSWWWELCVWEKHMVPKPNLQKLSFKIVCIWRLTKRVSGWWWWWCENVLYLSFSMLGLGAFQM